MAKTTNVLFINEVMTYSKMKYEGKYRKYLNRLCEWIIKDIQKSTGEKIKLEVGLELKVWQKQNARN